MNPSPSAVNVTSSTAVIPYHSHPHRRVTCIVSPDDPSDPTSTYYGEADAWLTETIDEKAANSITRFDAARSAEFDSLVAQGFFSIVHMNEAIFHTVFNARFVDEIRHVGTPQAKYKSRFIAQVYKDKAQGYSTTLQLCKEHHSLPFYI